MDEKTFAEITDKMLSSLSEKNRNAFILGQLLIIKKSLDFLSKLGLKDEFMKECSDPALVKVFIIIKDMLKFYRVLDEANGRRGNVPN